MKNKKIIIISIFSIFISLVYFNKVNIVDGASCAVDSDCASGNCNEFTGICSAAPNGASCAVDEDCVSKNCELTGKCEAASGVQSDNPPANTTPSASSPTPGANSNNSAVSNMGGIDIPKNTGLADSPIADILKNLLKWLLGIVGVIALIGFVISGIQYIIATGNEDMMGSAKRNMMYSILGIAVALGGVVIIKAIDLALRATSF